MKPCTIITSLAVLALWMSSCTTTQEELWIEADGSGRYESTLDLSAMYPFFLMGLQDESNEENGEGQDPFTAMIEEQLKAESADTTFSFGNIIEKELAAEGRSLAGIIDSLENLSPEASGMTAEEKTRNIQMLKTITNMKIRLRADQEKSLLQFTTISQFEDAGQMNNGASFMDALMGFRNQMSGMEGGAEEEAIQQMTQGQTRFEIKSGKLRIMRKGSDPTAGMSEDEAAQMQMMQAMVGDEPYRLTIHFPGKVRKVKSEFAEQTDDRTVVVKIPQGELNDEDFELDLSVKFKGMK